MKITKKNFVEVRDWDKLVINTYKRPYNFQQQEGCKSRGIFTLDIPSDYIQDEDMNESIPSNSVNGEIMGVKFKTWLTRDPKELLKRDKNSWSVGMFWERNFYPDIYTVANDLHKKGLIKAGEYVINIDW